MKFLKNKSIFELELEQKLEWAREKNERVFYRYIYDENLTEAKQWCKKNNIEMELSHISNGIKAYKFIDLKGE